LYIYTINDIELGNTLRISSYSDQKISINIDIIIVNIEINTILDLQLLFA